MHGSFEIADINYLLETENILYNTGSCQQIPPVSNQVLRLGHVVYFWHMSQMIREGDRF